MRTKLYRSRHQKMIAGVARGLAEHLNIDPKILRIIFIVLFFAGTAGAWVYILFWIFTGKEPFNANKPFTSKT